MTEPHLNQKELACRWRMSERTLERWRWAGSGPAWIKIGGAVRYMVRDVENYEQERRQSASGASLS